jgi:hypothetical protein
MKSTYSKYRIFNFSLLSWTLAVVALMFRFAATASATVPIYQNFSALTFTVPGNPPPPIDASNFDNENQFNISFESFSLNAQFYEPMNTVNYTNKSSGINTGLMTVNSPFIVTNGFVTDFNEIGAGFQFDTQTTNTIPHREAGTFYNAGEIRCDSVLDGNNLLNFQGFQFFDLINVGQCRVWATNILCPGTIDTSENGFIQLTGQNVDLSHADLTMEQGLVSSNNVDTTINSEATGINTNSWDPFEELTATNAVSSLPDNLSLAFPTSYFNELQTGPSNAVIRAVFIVNANTNVPASVYIAPAAFGNEGALIQWSGTFFNSATGETDTNYLYLFHFYFNSTNMPPVLTVGAIPTGFDEGVFDNFLWSQGTPFPGLPAPNTPGFQNIFNDNFITNVYEFFNASLTGTTVGTNASASNPSGALTNLPARIQITANNDLKLDVAEISGQNYLSLTATNQFDGSAGAQISTPYADINLGVTNGYSHPLTVSNLLVSNIPQWGGTLNEWSTRWTNTDVTGFTTDYRVMLVYANLTPSISPQVQSLTLNSSNLVISDVLNVFGSTFANAQNLTLTTNSPGGGASSPDGELNMQLQNPITWSWSGSFPNLFCLTNYGAIRTPNYSDFIGSSSITNITPAIPPVQASATLFEKGPSNNIAAGGTVTIGSTTYDFVSSLINTTPFQVKVGANFNGSMSNLIAAINRGPGAGTSYSTNTFASSVAAAGLLNITNGSVVISANLGNYPGTLGNNIPESTTVTNLAWSSSVLIGGVDGVPGSTNFNSVPVPYSAIINNGYIADQGSTIWVTNFLNGGVISNGPGSFLLTSLTATLTNGSIIAGGDISLVGNAILASNVMLQAGRSLVLQATNLLSDGSVSNGNVWAVGSTNGTGGNGLILPFLPVDTNAPQLNNLLGTTISLVTPPPNKEVLSSWAGLDYGESALGYTTNNVAIGQLILTSESPFSDLAFSGPAGSTNNNAIYVDRLVLQNYASLADKEGSAGIPTLVFNSNPNAGNLTIYYADAVSSATVNGGPLLEVSYLLNGLNGGHLVWVPEYTGYFSATNMVYPDGSTNRLNVGLATGGGSSQLDSNGNGTPNASDSDPLFVRGQMNFQNLGVINGSNELVWNSPPGSTNFVLSCTSNFMSWNPITIVTNSSVVPPPGGWPITNVVYEPTNAASGSYRVKIIQDNSVLYGQ